MKRLKEVQDFFSTLIDSTPPFDNPSSVIYKRVDHNHVYNDNTTIDIKCHIRTGDGSKVRIYNTIDDSMSLKETLVEKDMYELHIEKDRWIPNLYNSSYIMSIRNEKAVGDKLIVFPAESFLENIPDNVIYIAMNNYGSVDVHVKEQKDLYMKIPIKYITQKNN